MSQDRTGSLSVSLGIAAGLLLGIAAGILYAPKAGKETQDDIQTFLTKVPDKMNDGLSKSKDLMGKTREGIETQLEQRSKRRQASRMALAKQREALEFGYDY